MKFSALDMSIEPHVEGFFDPVSNTISYIVKDLASQACAIIDSVLDFDHSAERITYASADRLINVIRERQLVLEWIIETHVHADHLSAAPYIQKNLAAGLVLVPRLCRFRIRSVKFSTRAPSSSGTGHSSMRFFEDGDTYSIGEITAFTISTPGHTPACMVHVFGNAAFGGRVMAKNMMARDTEAGICAFTPKVPMPEWTGE